VLLVLEVLLVVVPVVVVIVVPLVSVLVMVVLIVSVDIVPVVPVVAVSVMVVDDVSVVTLVSVVLVADSFLQAVPKRASATIVRSTRKVFFILIPLESCFVSNCTEISGPFNRLSAWLTSSSCEHIRVKRSNANATPMSCVVPPDGTSASRRSGARR
jgi:hypothetical protein